MVCGHSHPLTQLSVEWLFHPVGMHNHVKGQVTGTGTGLGRVNIRLEVASSLRTMTRAFGIVSTRNPTLETMEGRKWRSSMRGKVRILNDYLIYSRRKRCQYNDHE